MTNRLLLMLTVAKMTFSRNDRPNRHAWHDVGLAMGNLHRALCGRLYDFAEAEGQLLALVTFMTIGGMLVQAATAGGGLRPHLG